jgi:hypothetical protein
MVSALETCLSEDLALMPGILHGNREIFYNKEDWTDLNSALHRAAFSMYSRSPFLLVSVLISNRRFFLSVGIVTTLALHF